MVKAKEIYKREYTKRQFENNMDIYEWEKKRREINQLELNRLHNEKSMLEIQIKAIENDNESLSKGKKYLNLNIIDKSKFKVLGK